MVQDTGKTLSLFKSYHRQIFFFSQSLSQLGKYFTTHLPLECRCLIIYLIYKPVYGNLIKDFWTSKGAKSLDVSIITRQKTKVAQRLSMWLKKKDVKKKNKVGSPWRVEAISRSLISRKICPFIDFSVRRSAKRRSVYSRSQIGQN